MKKLLIQFLRCLPFAALLFTMVAGAADQSTNVPAPVSKIMTFRDGDSFTTELATAGTWNISEAKIQFFPDAIQIDLPQAFLDKGKQLVKVEDRIFKSIYATQADASTVRAKLSMNEGLNATSLQGAVQLRKTTAGVALVVTGDATTATGRETSTEAVTIAVNDETATDALPTTLVAGAGTETPAEPSKTINPADEQAKIAAMNKLPESEIPVLTKEKLTKKEAGTGLPRLMITMGVLTVLLGAAAFGVKRYSGKVGKSKQHQSIKIITQHHIGPKKSLAIVQVAGESILIGVTDHNISMLKSLSLIDDEVPEELPARFDHALEAPAPAPRKNLGGRVQPQIQSAQFDEEDGEDFAMQGLSEIRDVVSTRLKNMRNF